MVLQEVRTSALAFTLGLGCTAASTTAPRPSASPPPSDVPTAPTTREDHPRPDPTFTLGLMYWAPPAYVLGGSHALVVGGEVIEVHEEQAADPQLRGPMIAHATIRVEHVFADVPPVPREGSPAQRYVGEPRIRFDGADGLALGDHVIVFAESYDGGYGIVPKRDTGVQVGIRVADWSDPIVAAIRRTLAGTADLRSPADAEPWRRYGEAAIACVLEGVPHGHCGVD